MAALLPPSEGNIQPDRALNYSFGLLLHVYQIGFGTAVIWLPFVSLVVYASTMINLSRGRCSWYLI
ncbi:MAG: hypothetical protein MK180_16395 [Rhodobacteraceae bacterium]|nr:hypothetical protein [Paracoccaceae bacterium]